MNEEQELLYAALYPHFLQDFCVELKDAKNGLNALGISLALIYYAPYDLNPPHTHPRANEILVVLESHSMWPLSHPT
ncbi:germin-like protein subfamily 1 member 7 isoform X3 [Gossypium australe]|uniref:Germin-like protein subfamily 1 member 7 isoform X3 n=1 Tax=Gossypium australe TaxID=47621 RepID=A0A5B6VV69_9ROSI|nr:germin-like protein subfamily 1 member 7 isoform X3 [Gossypium australe]